MGLQQTGGEQRARDRDEGDAVFADDEQDRGAGDRAAADGADTSGNCGTYADASDVDRERAAGHQVERVDARPFLPGVPDLGNGPDVQLWPHLHGTDAMYLSLLRRG